MNEMIVLDLPLPPEKLYPNKRTQSTGFKGLLTKKARSTSEMIARLQRPDKPFTRANVRGTFYLPKERDGDNLNAWLKPYL